MKGKVLKIFYRAGQTWDVVLHEYLVKKKIPETIQQTLHQDLLAIVRDESGKIYRIAVEFKATDLHSSLVGKGIGGILRFELQRHYLPLRERKVFDAVWVIIAGELEFRDLMIVDSICAEHAVPKKTFSNQEKAVEGLIKWLESAIVPHDFALPIYINADRQALLLAQMWRLFPGVNNEDAAELANLEILKRNDRLSLAEFQDLVLDVYPDTKLGEESKMFRKVVDFARTGLLPEEEFRFEELEQEYKDKML